MNQNLTLTNRNNKDNYYYVFFYYINIEYSILIIFFNMTYCVGMKMDDGIVMVSDSRTNAGLDNVSTYKKMFTYSVGDRSIIIITSGNLSTSQHVYKTLENDINSSNPKNSLNLCKNFDEIANYVGEISLNHSKTDGISINTHLGSNFIIGGQISGQEHALMMVYPVGNYIRASEIKPFFQLGETKYGKPILDRLIRNETSLGDAARCALVSFDSTMKSDLTVGPPIDLVVYKKDSIQISLEEHLQFKTPFFSDLSSKWSEGLRNLFKELPKFDWEK